MNLRVYEMRVLPAGIQGLKSHANGKTLDSR
jgi:hypothetical protein